METHTHLCRYKHRPMSG